MRVAKAIRRSGLVAALVALGAGPVAASTGCMLPGNAGGLAAAAGTAMNALRTSEGQAPLRRDARLDRAAQAQACRMSQTGRFTHGDLGGGAMMHRIRATGFPAHLGAENLALGQADAGSVLADWMGSPAHRRNILLTEAEAYGAALAMIDGRPVWVMLFAGQ